MDAAEPLALVVLGAIIGWVVALIIEFLILKPHWIRRGREMTDAPTYHEVRDALERLNARIPTDQNDALADTSTLLTAISGQEQILQRIETMLTHSTKSGEMLTAALRSTVADIAATLEGQAQTLGRIETLGVKNANLAKSTEAAQTDLREQVDHIAAALREEDSQPRRVVVEKTKDITPDRLTDIKGIGPSYASRLRSAGIYTFEQLAVLTPAELCAMIKMHGHSPAEKWIEQARIIVSGRIKIEKAS